MVYDYSPSGVNITNPEPSVPHTGDGGKCFAGYECPENSTFPTPCPPGFYAPLEGMAACDVCEQGYYCINQTVNPTICPQGYYCPAGTEFAEQYPCDEGTYNNDTLQQEEADCAECPGGYFCDTPGLAEPTGMCLGA